MYRQISVFVAATASAAALSACATLPVSPEQLAAIDRGEAGGIIMSYLEQDGMHAAKVNFVNTQSQQIHTIWLQDGEAQWNGKLVDIGVEMTQVEPGTYRLLDGSLFSSQGNYTVESNMPMIQSWFREFSVGAGQVVDVGTLTVNRIVLTPLPQPSGQAPGNQPSQGARNATTYLAYNIADSDAARVDTVLAIKYPTLAARPVRRPLEAVLDRPTFEKIVADSHAADSSGMLPSNQEAQGRIALGLMGLLRTSPATQ